MQDQWLTQLHQKLYVSIVEELCRDLCNYQKSVTQGLQFMKVSQTCSILHHKYNLPLTIEWSTIWISLWAVYPIHVWITKEAILSNREHLIDNRRKLICSGFCVIFAKSLLEENIRHMRTRSCRVDCGPSELHNWAEKRPNCCIIASKNIRMNKSILEIRSKK